MATNDTWIVFGRLAAFWILECPQTGHRVMTEPSEGGVVLRTVRFPITEGE